MGEYTGFTPDHGDVPAHEAAHEAVHSEDRRSKGPKSKGPKVELSVQGDGAIMVMAIPVIVQLRQRLPEGKMAEYPQDLAPVIARAIRNGIPLGWISPPADEDPRRARRQLEEAFAVLGFHAGSLGEPSREENTESAVDFLTKNFDVELLIEMLQARLKRSVEGAKQ